MARGRQISAARAMSQQAAARCTRGAHTCKRHGHRAKAPGGVVQVQAVPLKQQVQVGIADVIGGVEEVEVGPPAGQSRRDEGG